jgi:hypothetical protein
MPNIRTASISRLTGSAAAAAALVGGSFAANAAAATLPPELPPLIAKMKTLSISTERFKASVSLHGHKLPKSLSGLRTLTINVSGEASFASPPSGIATATALGHSTQVRIVDGSVYVDEPAVASKDGGRPWIKSTPSKAPSPLGTGPGEANGATDSYAGVAKLIEAAKTVKALAPATVDGQPVSRFLFTVDPAKVEGGTLSSKARAKLRQLHVTPTAKVEVDIAASGLPVHTAGVIAFGEKLGIGFTADVLAVDFPLTVTPPPAQETITEGELLAKLGKPKHG